MSRGGGNKKKKTKTAAQKAAAARHAKFKQTRVQTFGGKRTSFSDKEKVRIKEAGYSVDGYSKAAPNKASGYSGTTGVSIGSKIKNPNPKTPQEVSGIDPVLNKAPLGDFNTNTDGKLLASSMSAGSAGGHYVDAGNARGFVSKEQAERMLANPEAYKMRPSEIRYLRDSMPFTDRASINDGTLLTYSGNISDLSIGTTGTTEGGYNPADSPLAGYLNKSLNIIKRGY